MDVYVVSDCWVNDAADVLGAGVSVEDAKAIADRSDPSRTFGAASWAPWEEDSYRTGWRRDALTADGEIHNTLFQEIVSVPLASAHPIIVMDDPKVALTWSGVGRGDALTKSSEIEEIGRQFGAP